MFVIVLFVLSLFQFNDAADFSISAKKNEKITMTEGDVPIILKVYDIRDDFRNGNCKGECTVNNIRKFETTCNFIDTPDRHLNILIQTRANKGFSGLWQCRFETDGLRRETEASEHLVQHFNLNVKVEPFDRSKLSPINLPLDDTVEFNITSPNEVNNFTLDEGNQTLVMFISGGQKQFADGHCNGWCEINKKENISSSSCMMYKEGNYAQLLFPHTLEVTKSYSGSWSCSVESVLDHKILFNINKLLIKVNIPDDTKTDTWLYVGIALGVLLILTVIVGQTICIIHFKSKAKKAEINKNLTPKNASDSLPDVRYVKKESTAGVGDGRESVIYEALDTVIAGKPIPPPIETLPVTPKPQHISRSISQNNLSAPSHERFTKTSHRPQKNEHNQGKFYTVDRSKSLERIKNRPPLPAPDEIYEVMAPGDAPEPGKTGWFKNKTQEQSPLLAMPQKKVLFGKNQPLPSQDQRVPTSPNVGRKPTPGPGRMQTGTLPGLSGPGQFPGPSGRPPAGAAVLGAMPVLPSMISAANLRPVKKTVRPPIGQSASNDFRMPQPDHPRMPVDTRMQGRTPENMQGDSRMQGNFRMPQDTRIQGNRMPENMQGEPRMPGNFRMPQDRMQGMPGPRMQENRFPGSRMQENPTQSGFRTPGPQDGFRMPVDARHDQPFMNMPKSNPGPVPFAKPKPPVPLPSPDPEPIEPDHEPEMYYGSSDEEFDCYDVLPEYRIYGNAPPKKLQ